MFPSTTIRKACFNFNLEGLRNNLEGVEVISERIQFDCLVFTCHCALNSINKEMFIMLVKDKHFDKCIHNDYLLGME